MGQRHVARLPLARGERDAHQFRPHDGAGCRERPERYPARGLQLRRERLHRVDRLDQSVVLGDRPGRRRELAEQRPEPEFAEQLEARLPVRPSVAERLDAHVDWRVAADPGQFAALTRQVAVREQRLAVLLLRHVGRAFEQCVERSERREQLARPLLADARHALDVVDGVAGQRQDVHDLLGRHAELLPHALRVEPGPLVARVEHPHAVVDQLEHVLVAGHDHHLVALVRRTLRHGPDHVVGLESLAGEHRDAERLAGAMDVGDLFGEVVRHRRAVRLVVGGQGVAEGRPGEVERAGDQLGPLVGDQLAQHRDEAVDGVGGPAIRAGQPADRVVGAIHLRIAVDQEQCRAMGGAMVGVHGRGGARRGG